MLTVLRLRIYMCVRVYIYVCVYACIIYMYVCVGAKLFQLCLTLCDLSSIAHQAPLPMGFRNTAHGILQEYWRFSSAHGILQEYWSGLPCTSAGDLPDPGIEPRSLVSPAAAGGFFTTSTTWEAP